MVNIAEPSVTFIEVYSSHLCFVSMICFAVRHLKHSLSTGGQNHVILASYKRCLLQHEQLNALSFCGKPSAPSVAPPISYPTAFLLLFCMFSSFFLSLNLFEFSLSLSRPSGPQFVLHSGHCIGLPFSLLCLKHRLRQSVWICRPQPYRQ